MFLHRQRPGEGAGVEAEARDQEAPEGRRCSGGVEDAVAQKPALRICALRARTSLRSVSAPSAVGPRCP